MGPEDIAKLIDEDPNIIENLKAVDLGPSKKAQARTRKRRLKRLKDKNKKEREFEKDKDDYTVGPDGQPKSGQVLYSDISTEKPIDLTESLSDYSQNAIMQALRGMGRAVERLTNSPWNRGEWESGMFKKNTAFFGKSKSRLESIARTLKGAGYTHSNLGEQGSVCQFLVDLERFKSDIADARTAAKGGGPSPIPFPRGEWWGQYNWSSGPSRRRYLEIFSGEVMVRFLGMVELQRDRHAISCKDAQCERLDHAEYVARELLCNGGVRLQKIFDHFNRERAAVISAGSKKKSKRKKDINRGWAPTKNPLHLRLVRFERALLDQFGKRYISSGMPRIPIMAPKGVDLRDYARKYLQLANVYFGDSADIDKLWQKSK